MPNCGPSCVVEMYGPGIDPNTLASGSHLVNYADETNIPCSLNNPAPFFYTDVIVLPTGSDYDLYRRKWNYVKNQYNSGYRLCEDVPACTGVDGDHYDARDQYTSASICSPSATPNAAYWLDDNRFKRQFYEHLFDWTWYAYKRGTNAVIFEKFVQWKFKTGSSTTLYGNLPQYKRNDHFGHCWMLCPYDNNNTDARMRAMLGLSEGEFPIEGRNDHGVYYMKTASRGNVWGFECTSPTCTYLTAYGKEYFYS